MGFHCHLIHLLALVLRRFQESFSWPFAFSSVSAPPFQCHHQEGNRIVALQRRCMIVCAPRLEQFGCPLVTEVRLFL